MATLRLCSRCYGAGDYWELRAGCHPRRRAEAGAWRGWCGPLQKGPGGNGWVLSTVEAGDLSALRGSRKGKE